MTQLSPVTVLDTDTLSAIMARQTLAVAQAQAYLVVHHQLTFSAITRYEILRGLHAKRATAQLTRFEQLCRNSIVLPLTDAAIMRAAIIYGSLHQTGELIGDADILIAASALEHNATLATNNNKHFRRIVGLQLVNWLV